MISIALLGLLLLVAMVAALHTFGHFERGEYAGAGAPSAFFLRFYRKRNHVTARGPRVEWEAAPTKEFYAAWEKSKAELKAKGYGFVQDKRARWNVVYWEKPVPPRDGLPGSVVSAVDEADPYHRQVVDYALARSSTLLQQRDGEEITLTLKIAAAASARRVLVICPADQKHAWKDAAGGLLPSLPATIIDHKEPLYLTGSNALVVMTYGVVSAQSIDIRNSSWDIVALHEADELKDPTSQRAGAIFGRKARDGWALMEPLKATRRIASVSETAFFQPKELYPLLGYLDRQTWEDEGGYIFRYCEPIKTRYGHEFGFSNNAELIGTLRDTILAPRSTDL